MNNSENMLISLEQQDLKQAQAHFEKALLTDDENVLFDLAQYLESIGFFPQAKRAYEQVAEAFPQAFLSLASIASEDGDIEEAFGYLEEIAPESDWYPASLVIKADLYQMEGLPDVAREKLEVAYQLSQDPLILLGLAEIEVELEDFAQAIKAYASLDNRKIYEQTGISTYQRIGWCYAQLGKLEVAIEFLEKALELAYEDQTALELALILVEQGEYQRALMYFKQLDTLSQDYEGYEYGYALALHAEHQTKEALVIAQQGLLKNPFETRLSLLASQYAYELHDEAGAENYLLDALKDAVEQEDLLLRLTNLYLEQERFEDVLAFVSDEIDSSLTKWNLARAYQGLEKEEEALLLYREISQDMKDNPEFLEAYSYLLRELGYLTKAKETAKSYLKLVPDDPAMVDFYHSLEE
ncbi:tetratricopeptide repeat protein [Streptococcus himalayensis]|uniref:Tetratricopeptide repeat protein n=1 Tax=Streptococcus himalayensis TaxID=1888195 RepID=A0A917A4R8_9STRE|nr:tetratricopeptide repeat protein [Streptococcus himalayensis]GGE26721.1 hypothetical protein GCM10011510_04900 [Streptococcus himalayensis]